MGFIRILKGKKEPEGDSPSTSQPATVEEQIAYHPDADDNGGMLCTNDELLKQQREAIMQWVKSMGRRLLTGNINLINTPFPVTIFEPRSYLEKLADVWVYPRYLTAASQSSDPVERMKLVTAWFVAGLHHAFENWRKPFNPILGETWQARLSDGTTMYMEQISHHPPVSAFHMEGPGGSYRFRGLSQPTVSIVVKHYGFKTVAKGFRYVDFPDGTRIELHYPQYYIKNVACYGCRPRAEVDGQAILVDVRNKLKTVINFGPLKGARNKVLRRADAVHGFVYDCRDHQASLDDRTSTADLAETVGVPQTAELDQHAAVGDDDEFESASENEYDPDKDEADAATALEMAAAAAAAAERRDSGSASDGGAEEAASDLQLPSPSVGLGSDGQWQGSLNGLDSGTRANGKTGTTPSGSVRGGDASSMRQATSNSGSGSGSSFFGMAAIKGVGTMFGLSQAPPASCVDPQPNALDGTPLARVEGSWLSHLSIGGRSYWSVTTEVPDRWQAAPDPLPSDSRFRQDLMVLEAGDLKAAQRAKEHLENLQRSDKKLREAMLGSRYGSYH